MIIREALADDQAEPVHATDRRAYYARQIEGIRRMQAAGEIRGEIDPEMLFLALLAVIMLPSAMPQIVRLAVDMDPATPAFRDRWNRVLEHLADALGPGDLTA